MQEKSPPETLSKVETPAKADPLKQSIETMTARVEGIREGYALAKEQTAKSNDTSEWREHFGGLAEQVPDEPKQERAKNLENERPLYDLMFTLYQAAERAEWEGRPDEALVYDWAIEGVRSRLNDVPSRLTSKQQQGVLGAVEGALTKEVETQNTSTRTEAYVAEAEGLLAKLAERHRFSIEAAELTKTVAEVGVARDAERTQKIEQSFPVEKHKEWIDRVSAVGKWYRSLPKWLQVGVGASVAGIGLAGALTGGPLAATVAGITYAGSRGLSFLGAFAVADAATERMKNRYAAGAISVGAGAIWAIAVPTTIQAIDAYFDHALSNAVQKAVGSLADLFGTPDTTPKVPTLGTYAAAEMATVPDNGLPKVPTLGTYAAQEMATVPGNDLPKVPTLGEYAAAEMADAEAPPTPLQAAPVVPVESAPLETAAVPQSVFKDPVTVNEGDSKKGLWGILERKLQAAGQITAETSSTEKNALIAGLEKKLSMLSQEQLQQIGFKPSQPGGKALIGVIRPGEVLNLSILDSNIHPAEVPLPPTRPVVEAPPAPAVEAPPAPVTETPATPAAPSNTAPVVEPPQTPAQAPAPSVPAEPPPVQTVEMGAAGAEASPAAPPSAEAGGMTTFEKEYDTIARQFFTNEAQLEKLRGLSGRSVLNFDDAASEDVYNIPREKFIDFQKLIRDTLTTSRLDPTRTNVEELLQEAARLRVEGSTT